MPCAPGAAISNPSGASSPAFSDRGPLTTMRPTAPAFRAAATLARRLAWRRSPARRSSSAVSGEYRSATTTFSSTSRPA